MNNSDSVSDIQEPRPTLKLKVAPRKPLVKVEQTPTPTAKSQSKASQKPGARWSDDYKRMMQSFR